MREVIRTLLAAVAGMAVALALVVAVELFSAVVHPLPADFDGDMGAHVRRYPDWVLAVAAAAWSATAWAATCVATRLANRIAGGVVALLLAWALIFNLSMLPYPTWFKVAMLIAFPIACLVGIAIGKRAVSPTSTATRDNVRGSVSSFL